jgi:predicted transcriptional regulator
VADARGTGWAARAGEKARVLRKRCKDLLQRVFGGKSVALVASVFETQPPTQNEIHEMQQLLNQLRLKRGEEEKRK